jgi:hypothetical protein
MSGEHVVAEEVIVDGDDPVGQRRLFEIADAVDVHRDPVVAGGDVLGGLSVSGVGVVEKRGREKRGEINGNEKQKQQGPGAPRGRVKRRLYRGSGRLLFRHGWKCHWLGARHVIARYVTRNKVQNNSVSPQGAGMGR